MSEEEKKTPEPEENKPSEKDEIDVTLGEEKEEVTETPEWVKRTRQSNRDLRKQNLNLKRQLEEKDVEKSPTDPGPKPTLESCDFKADEFGEKLDEWHEKNRVHKSEQEAANASWQEQLNGYQEKRDALAPRVTGFDEAEATTKDYLNDFQQGILIKAAENPALVVYFLGKNPDELERISKTKDHFKFSAEVAKLEAKLKTTKRKPVTQPEEKVEGSASTSGGEDAVLEKLRAEAAETGDHSKVIAHRKKMRDKP